MIIRIFLLILLCIVPVSYGNFDVTSASNASYSCESQTLRVNYIAQGHHGTTSLYKIVGPGIATIPAWSFDWWANWAIAITIPSCPNLCSLPMTPAGTLSPSAWDQEKVIRVRIKPKPGFTKRIPATVVWSPRPDLRQCCTGDFPSHSTICQSDDGLATRSLVSTCTDAGKCEYICSDGYKFGPEQATAESNTSGTFAKITKWGSGYSAVPIVTVSWPKCSTPPIAIALLSDTLEVKITNKGSGYGTAAPLVTVTGGNCIIRPTATAILEHGSVSSVTLRGALGCTVPPSFLISIAPPAGVTTTPPTGWTWTQAQGKLEVATFDTAGIINNAGSGYTLTPDVTVNDVYNVCTTDPQLTAIVGTSWAANGTITGLTVTDQGDCTGIPTLTIEDPGGTWTTATGSLKPATFTGVVQTPGSGYTSDPIIQTDSADVCTVDPVVTATRWAGGTITGITVTTHGNCTDIPVLIIAPPAGATPSGPQGATASIALSTKKSVTGITLSGAIGCTETPTLTIAAPTATTPSICTPIQCLGFPKPGNGQYCEGDIGLAGHVDLMNTHRADASQCTSNQKCEWFCPVDNPFFCEAQNTCVKTQNDCTTTACKTSAPSELKAEVDQPYIQCDAVDTANTHFRYKITSGASSNAAAATLKPATFDDIIGNPGSGYSTITPPTVTVDTNNVCTTDPIITATVGTGVDAGKVKELNITSPGVCSGVPTVTIAPPSSGATTGPNEVIVEENATASTLKINHTGDTIKHDCWFGDTTKKITLATFMTFQSALNAGIVTGDKLLLFTGNPPGSTQSSSSIYWYTGSLWENATTSAAVPTSTQLSNFFVFRTNTQTPRTLQVPKSTINFYGCYPENGRPANFNTPFSTAATATLKPATFSYTLTSSGSGYTSAPSVTVNNTGTVCATVPTVTTSITNWSVTSLTISGWNCTGIPTLTIDPAPTSGSGTGLGYISPLFTVGTSVKHPTTFNTGTYTVTCLYGTPANTNSATTDYGMTAGTCTKIMAVNSTSQGCNRIYGYRGTTLSENMSSETAFDASFRCGSRNPIIPTTDPKAFRLHVGMSEPAFLIFDPIGSDLLNGLGIGPISTQTQSYSFTSTKDITCAVKVGDGYSTNSSCQVRACVGQGCGNPQTFIVVPSSEETCTLADTLKYDVGCNPSSPDYIQCLRYFFEWPSGTYPIKINGIISELDCDSTIPPGALGPVKTCTVILPTGGSPVTIFAGDITAGNYSFQTTEYTLAKDTGKPAGTLEYFTDENQQTKLTVDQYQYWQKNPVTAVITCNDRTSTNASWEADGSGCACSRYLYHPDTTVTQFWSLGVPSINNNIGPDKMAYMRTLVSNNWPLPAVRVQDTAGNISDESFIADIGVDSLAPKVTATWAAGGTVTLTFTDAGGSGFWKPLSALNDTVPTGMTKNLAVLYKVVDKGTFEFDANCSIPVQNTNYFKYKEWSTTQPVVSVPVGAGKVVAYCIQDNAGNVNRGYYPNQVTGCFSASNMSPRPLLSLLPTSTYYATLLNSRLTSSLLPIEKYGYSFSENPSQAECFRGILFNNISTLVANQYTARTTMTLSSWENDRAPIKNTNNLLNMSGYYYYSYTSPTNNTLSITSSPGGTGQKAVVVESGNIQINENIEYTGGDKTLILVARKNTGVQGQGGNIYIAPNVTRIDAILIADGGAVMNGTTVNGVTTPKNWVSNPSDVNNRLIINGRIYSYNTRGGSIQLVGTEFDKVTGTNGKIFVGSALTPVPPGPTAAAQAGVQDLERLRAILPDGNAQCSVHVNYQSFTSSTLPLLLTRPNWFTLGSCGF